MLTFPFSLDLILFFFLLSLFIYLVIAATLTNLHKAYLAFHFCMMFWSFLQFLINKTDSRELQLDLLKAVFVDVLLVAIGWFAFSMFLTGHSRFLRKKISLLIYIPAIIATLAVVINPNDWFVAAAEHEYSRRTYGPLFWIIMLVVFSYFFVSVQVIRRTLKSDAITSRSKKLARNVLKGMKVLISFAALDILFNVALASWLPVIPGLTSFGILCAVTIFVVSIQRDKMLDIVTIAHQDIIDTLNQGILVLDERETVLEINRSLRDQLDLQIGDRFDMNFLKSERYVSDQIERFLDSYRNAPLQKLQVEFVYMVSRQKYFTIHASPIIISGVRHGRIITFQDVSQTYQLINKTNLQNHILREQNESLTEIKDKLSQTNSKLEQMAIVDSLTGCYNRHYLTQHLELEVMKNMRSQIPFSIILLDIDFFKSVNDQYGHLVGDEVICGTVKVIKKSLRQTDILARYGGEELLLYLPHTNHASAIKLAERLRSIIESNKILVENDGISVSITVSMGLYSINQFRDTYMESPAVYLKDLLANTDEALYQAKKEGRNRVISKLA